MKRVTLAATALLISASPMAIASPAAAEPHERFAEVGDFLNPLIESQLAESDIPGAAVSVVSEGELVHSQGYGVSDLDSEEPVNAETTGFLTASVSKMFISQAVLNEVEAGRLDLDTDVNEYLDGFSIADTYPGEPVTLQHLLTHTAGFDENMDGLIRQSPDDVEPLGEWVDENQPDRKRPPGTVVSYDNYGTALAAHIVEEVTGEDFADYVDDNMLSPLNMDSTTLQVPHPDDIAAKLATGYMDDGTTEATGHYAGAVPAGSGPVTTAEDMARWMIAQLDSDNDTAERMRQNHYQQDERIAGGMGYLYENTERNGHRIASKGGDVTGFHSIYATLPEHDTGIYIAYNGDGKDDAAAKGRAELINRFIDEYFPGEPEDARAISDDAAPFAGQYRSARASDTSLSRLGELFDSPLRVEAHSNGSVTVHDLFIADGPTTWDQTAPGVFTQRDEQQSMSFDGGVLTLSEMPTMAFEKIEWYQSPQLHLIALASSAAVFLIGLIAWPVTAVVRRMRGRQPHPRLARVSRMLAGVSAAGVVASGVGVVALLADPTQIVMGSALTTLLPPGTALLTLPIAAMVALTILAWWKGWWTVLGRSAYTISALAGVVFMSGAFMYNFAALPLV